MQPAPVVRRVRSVVTSFVRNAAVTGGKSGSKHIEPFPSSGSILMGEQVNNDASF